jgi:hypothetical protein
MDFFHTHLFTRFSEPMLLFILSIPPETTTLYLSSWEVFMVVDLETRIFSKTVGPNLLEIRLARTLVTLLVTFV